MKVLYLTDQTYLHGGIEKVLSQKADYLAENLGAVVTIVTHSQQGKEPVYPFSPKIKHYDLGVNYRTGTSYFHPHNLLKIRRHVSALRQIFRRLKPDIVVSCSFGPDFYFLPFIEKRIPKIKEFHGSRYQYGNLAKQSLKKKVLHRLDGFAEKRYNALALLNHSEQPFFRNQTVAVIPNPAELRSATADLKSKKILAAGRISPVKNFSELITGFARLSPDFPDWELHFWGEDYIGTRASLEKQIDAAGLQQKVIFKGQTPDLTLEMRNYSIYALTSHTECFPMVLLEALSVGLPVISYDAPTGPRHILTDNEDSFLVPPGNLDIFAEKLRLFMSDEKLRNEMGAAGRENVRRFDIGLVMKKWTDLFNTIIDRKREQLKK